MTSQKWLRHKNGCVTKMAASQKWLRHKKYIATKATCFVARLL